jgi:DNA-binding Lrp family transcriptional regulator
MEVLGMSFKLMAKALDVKTGSPLTKLILLKLCDNANDQGECWPSQNNIADQCETSRETVNRHIKKLVDLKLITKVDQYKKGVQTVSKYMISLGVTEDHSRCDGESQQGVTEDHTEPIIEPTKEEKYKKDCEDFKEDIKATWERLGGESYMPLESVKEFYNHFIERSKSGVMRFQAQTFFEIPKRLATWKRQSTRWGNNQKPVNPNVRPNA